MSTKIWEAYCIKPEHDVWTVMWDLRRRAEQRVRKTLTKFYRALIEDVKLPAKERAWLIGTAGASMDASDFTYLSASRFVQSEYKQTIGRSERSIWDLNVSVVVRRASRKRTLLIPYPGSGLLNGSLAFMRRHKALADYHYQNQSDRPSHVSARTWRERARTWDPLLDDENWQDKLVLEIVSIDGFFRVDPVWNLMRREFRRTGKLPEPQADRP